jgi:hypothetical protein
MTKATTKTNTTSRKNVKVRPYLKAAYDSNLVDIVKAAGVKHEDVYKSVFKIIAHEAFERASADCSSRSHGPHWNVAMVLNRKTSDYNRKCVNGTAEEVENAAKSVCIDILGL